MKRKPKIYDIMGKRLVKGDFVTHTPLVEDFFRPNRWCIGNLIKCKNGNYDLQVLGSKGLISRNNRIEFNGHKLGLHIGMFKV